MARIRSYVTERSGKRVVMSNDLGDAELKRLLKVLKDKKFRKEFGITKFEVI